MEHGALICGRYQIYPLFVPLQEGVLDLYLWATYQGSRSAITVWSKIPTNDVSAKTRSAKWHRCNSKEGQMTTPATFAVLRETFSSGVIALQEMHYVSAVISFFVRIYARTYISLKGYGISLRGMRVALSLLRRPRILDVQGVKIYFDPRISSSYVRLIAGEWNEPETHSFVSRVLSVSQMPVQVINVGANVGEMVLDFARQPSVEKVVAYEPLGVACEAIRRSVILNNLENVSLMHAACGTDSRVGYLQVQKNSQTSRIVENPSHTESLPVQVLTLNDLELSGNFKATVLIVDVEGAEYDVMRGADSFLERLKPVVVFEFTADTRNFFSLDDVQQLLGPDYTIFRLRSDGELDRDFSKTWNCVALSSHSSLYETVMGMIKTA